MLQTTFVYVLIILFYVNLSKSWSNEQKKGLTTLKFFLLLNFIKILSLTLLRALRAFLAVSSYDPDYIDITHKLCCIAYIKNYDIDYYLFIYLTIETEIMKRFGN